jgi:hypothetical protein
MACRFVFYQHPLDGIICSPMVEYEIVVADLIQLEEKGKDFFLSGLQPDPVLKSIGEEGLMPVRHVWMVLKQLT